MAGYEIWLRSSPPRYSPATRIRNRQPNPGSSHVASINGILNQTPERDQYPKLNWCSFQVPSSDGLIGDDTSEGIPTFPVPNENDGFTVVRRYLYDVLTGTGWGISDKYPAAIRATVESWYGNGGYFRTLFATEDGLSNLCPEYGKNGEGKEVGFHGKSRELIRNCVKHETRLLLHREVDLEDIISEADTYVDSNTPDIIRQEKTCLHQNREKGIHPAFRTSLESNKYPATAPKQDRRDGLNTSETLEHLRGSASSSRTVHFEARESKGLSSSKDLIAPELRPKTPPKITHDITVQVHALKDKQPKRQEGRRASPNVVDGVGAKRKSVTRHTISSHKSPPTPQSQSQLSSSEGRSSEHKNARCNPTLRTENPTRAEPQLGRKRSSKVVKPMSRVSLSSIRSMRYEALPPRRLPSTEDSLLLDAATRAANQAQALALNVDEARQLNHHERKIERKKGNIFSRVFGRLGGKKG